MFKKVHGILQLVSELCMEEYLLVGTWKHSE